MVDKHTGDPNMKAPTARVSLERAPASASEPFAIFIDWIAGTIARDPELLAAARVIRDDLDARGVVRRRHAPPVNVPKAADAGR